MSGGKVFWDSFGSFPLASGIGVYSRNLRSSLVQLGLPTVCLLAKDQDDAGLGRPALLRAKLSFLPNRIKLLWPHVCCRELYDIIKESGDRDRVHIFHGLSNLNLPVFSKRNDKFRYVVTIHDLIPLFPGAGVSASYKAQFDFMLPRVVTFADKILCVSKWTRDLLCERFPEAEAKSLIVHNGVDHLNQHKPAYKGLSRDADRKNLLYVARWEEYKGFEIMVAVAEKLPKDFLLTVITDQLGVKKLLKIGGKAFSRGRLRVLSNLSGNELRKKYSEADLYLHFSRYEGFGLPLWESLSSRTPVLLTEGSAVSDIMNRGVAWGVRHSASAKEWLDLINEKKDIKSSVFYQNRLTKFLGRSPTWGEAASKVKEVYNQLM